MWSGLCLLIYIKVAISSIPFRSAQELLILSAYHCGFITGMDIKNAYCWLEVMNERMNERMNESVVQVIRGWDTIPAGLCTSFINIMGENSSRIWWEYSQNESNHVVKWPFSEIPSLRGAAVANRSIALCAVRWWTCINWPAFMNGIPRKPLFVKMCW